MRKYFDTPQCPCGEGNDWEFLSVAPSGPLKISVWQCRECDRPAYFFYAEGVNAFVTTREKVLVFPNSIATFISTRLIPVLNDNIALRESLLAIYDIDIKRELTAQFGVTSNDEICRLDEKKQFDYLVESARYYISVEEWLDEEGFRTLPLNGAFPKEARIYFRARHKPQNTDRRDGSNWSLPKV